MKKSTAAVLIAVVAVLGIIGVVYATNNSEESKVSDKSSSSDVSNNNTSNSQASNENQVISESEVTMDIKDFDFSKPDISIKKGTKVTWTNRDSSRHDVTPDDPTAEFQASKLLAQGESYSVTFNTVGLFNYICSPHPYMKAVIKVVE